MSGQAAANSVSVVVPTYREVLNLPALLERLAAVRVVNELDMEVLIMDDASRDGSEAAVARFGASWVSFIERTRDRGLSPAVVDGLRLATKDIVLVMDADLSHPPERVVDMLDALASGHDFVIGSRYVDGGSTDDDWGFLRWLNSRIATLLARPLTRAKDPMAGFFAMRREQLRLGKLNPIGYKIGLELIVKCGVKNLTEIPIHFTDRTLGESKLSLKEQLRYIQHLRRLYIYRYAGWSEFLQFALVGASGVVVNLAVLSLILSFGVEKNLAIACAIFVSIVSNFLLNRRYTFGYARDEPIWKQFIGFVAASSFGALVNYAMTLFLLGQMPETPVQLAAVGGVVAGLLFNFLANRFLVFRKRHVRLSKPSPAAAATPPE